MATIILYLVMAAGIAASIGGFIFHERTVGRDGQKKDDAPIIAKAEKRAGDAEAANESLTKDLSTLKSACAVTEKAVDGFRDAQNVALAASRAVQAQVAAGEQRTSQRIAALKDGAQSTGGKGCENDSAVLRGVAADLLRNEPATDK